MNALASTPIKARNAVLSFSARLALARDVAFTGSQTSVASGGSPFDPRVIDIIARQSGMPAGQLNRMFDQDFVGAHAPHDESEGRAPWPPASLVDFDARDVPQTLVRLMLEALLPGSLAHCAAEVEADAGVLTGSVRHDAMSSILDAVTGVLLEMSLFELTLAVNEQLLPLDEAPGAVVAGYGELMGNLEYVEYLQQKYPVMVVRLRERVAQASRRLGTFFSRLRDDWPQLRTLINSRDETPIVEGLVRNAGDSHHGADAVSVVRLRGGHSVVYKPRSVSAEAGTQRFLSWVNSLEGGLEHRVIWVLDREDYGWVEFVPANEIDDVGGESRYFERYGRLLAAMHFLNATDIHHENLIACGEYPVVVDLETILQPTRIVSRDGDESHLMDLEFYQKSPLFTAMIDPVFFETALNSSPLATQLTRPRRERLLEWSAKGAFRTRTAGTEERSAHLPRRDGSAIDPFAYRMDVERGFRAAYCTLLRHKAFMVGAGFETWFRGGRVRIIFKATSRYGKFLSALNSAYAQGGTPQHDEYLEQLWRPCFSKPALAHVALAESDDLWRGDIPYFSANVASTDVVDSFGRRIDALLTQSPLEAAREKVALLTAATLELDAAVVASCLARRARDRDMAVITRDSGNGEEVSFSHGASHAAIFATIRRCLQFDAGRLAFVDLNSARDHATRHRPLGDDLYTGLPGVCFALAYESALSRKEVDIQHTRDLAAHCFSTFDDARSYSVGMCQGSGGLAYVAAHLASIWSDEGYARIGVALCERMKASAYGDRHFDIFSGSAGGVLAALAVGKVDRSGRALDVASRLCKHLRDFAIPQGETTSWMSSIPSRGATTGFAHGVSGIAFALARAYEILGMPYLLELAVSAERFVHRCFRQSQQSWLEDESDVRERRMQVWCHGAPGIAGMYAALIRITDDADIAGRYRTALDITSEQLEFDNDSLCHGTLGNLDPLLALRDGGAPSEEVLRRIGGIKASLEGRRALCGNRYKHFSQSLFNGFSGMAYQLLRIDSPQPLPSILTFDAPIHGD